MVIQSDNLPSVRGILLSTEGKLPSVNLPSTGGKKPSVEGKST